MGFLSRLFSADPLRDLERAESLLDKGERERALELARRAAAHCGPKDQRRAAALVVQVKESLAAAALEKASLAVASEYFEDAAEWVLAAVDHVDDEEHRRQLEARAETLLARAREAEAEEAYEHLEGPADSPEPATELDPESHFHALTGMLVEDVAERYAARPSTFRVAYIDLNEGRLEGALAALDELVEERREDPVIRFERGRCRLLLGDASGAASDFETVWEALGAAPVDLAGELSVPALWAEAMLAQGEAELVIGRLKTLAEPAAGYPTLTARYAESLLAAARNDEARELLVAAARRFPSQSIFPYHLARALVRLDDRPAAIDCLEAAIAPSCASGHCAKPAKHLPSLRALASLYLDAGDDIDRAGELLRLVARELRGRLTAEDFALVARYQERLGNPEAAQRALVEARRLSAEAKTAAATGAAAAPELVGQQRAVL